MLFTALFLAIIQGLTEFLPVSSSGHLVVFHSLSGHATTMWYNTLVLDVAVHIGTLIAVLVYFRNQVKVMAQDMAVSLQNNSKASIYQTMPFYIIAASIPIIVVGFLLFVMKPDFLRSLTVMAWMTVIFGVVLGVADKKYPASRSLNTLTLRDSILIGMFQILSLIPGVSRSGITMTAGRICGLGATDSAIFSLYLSIIAIMGAGALAGYHALFSDDAMIGLTVLIAVFFSFICGYVSIGFMMKILQKYGFMPFVVYRICLGGLLLVLIHLGIVPA